MLFDFSRTDAAIRYKLLSATVTPRPIAWVSTLDAAGQPNAAPFSYFNVFGEDPPVVGFSILSRSPTDGKDTGRNVRQRGEFVINLVSEDTLDAMAITAIEFPPEVDEFAEAGLTPASSTGVQVPRIAQSRVSLECRLMQILNLGPKRSLVLGEVLAMHIADEAILDAERGHLDTPSLQLVGRAGPNAYVATTVTIIKSTASLADWEKGRVMGRPPTLTEEIAGTQARMPSP